MRNTQQLHNQVTVAPKLESKSDKASHGLLCVGSQIFQYQFLNLVTPYKWAHYQHLYKLVKRGHLLSEKKSVCLGSWLSLRSFTIVDCQSQIPHIKPQCMQVCIQMTFCGKFVSVHSPFPSDLRPW